MNELITFKDAQDREDGWAITELVKSGVLNPEPVFDLMSENPFVTEDNLEVPAYAREAVKFI